MPYSDMTGAFRGMPDKLMPVACAAALAFGLYSLLSATLVWLRFHVELPIWDLAYFLPLIETAIVDGLFETDIADWLSLHAGAHRVPIIKALMYIDYSFFSGRNLLIYSMTAATVLLTVYIFHKASKPVLAKYSGSSIFVIGLTLAFIFSPMNYSNLVDPTCSTWFFNLAFSAAGMWILVANGSEAGPRATLAVAMFGMAAAFSNFAGILFCLLAPVVAFLVRSPFWKQLTLASILFCIAYTYGIAWGIEEMKPASGLNNNPEMTGALEFLLQSIQTVVRMINGVYMMLGFPFSAKMPWAAAGLFFTSVAVLAFFWIELLLSYWKKVRKTNASVVFFLSMATMQIGIAIAVIIGREWFYDPTHWRYQTITVSYWISIVLLVLAAVSLRTTRWTPVIAGITLCVSIAIGLAMTNAPDGTMNYASEEHHRERALLQLGLSEQKLTVKLAFPWREQWKPHVDFVAEQRPELVARPPMLDSGPDQRAATCPGIKLKRHKVITEDADYFWLNFTDPVATRETRVHLVSQGELYGTFYPTAPRSLWPHKVLHSEARRWRGIVKRGYQLETSDLVQFQAGRVTRCNLGPAA